jgi:hypothetical protein
MVAGSTIMMPPPFGRTASVLPFAGGFVVGDGGSWEFRVHDAAGKLLSIFRAAGQGTLVSARVRRQYETEAVLGLTGVARSQRLGALQSNDYPERAPVYRQLLVDEVGRLWAEHYPLPGDANTRWAVFAADGTLLGNAATPRGHRVSWIGRDEIVTVQYDSGTRSTFIHVFGLRPVRY